MKCKICDFYRVHKPTPEGKNWCTYCSKKMAPYFWAQAFGMVWSQIALYRCVSTLQLWNCAEELSK